MTDIIGTIIGIFAAMGLCFCLYCWYVLIGFGADEWFSEEGQRRVWRCADCKYAKNLKCSKYKLGFYKLKLYRHFNAISFKKCSVSEKNSRQTVYFDANGNEIERVKDIDVVTKKGKDIVLGR